MMSFNDTKVASIYLYGPIIFELFLMFYKLIATASSVTKQKLLHDFFHIKGSLHFYLPKKNLSTITGFIRIQFFCKHKGNFFL